MNTKRIIAIALILMLALSLAACGGGGTPPGGNTTNPPATTPGATPSGNNDPCPCCPNCNQEECECAECGDSEDCECELPGGEADWVIEFENAIYSMPHPLYPDAFDIICTLNFVATKSGGNTMHGVYSGEGTLTVRVDGSKMRARQPGLIIVDAEVTGPLTATFFFDSRDPDENEEAVGDQVYKNHPDFEITSGGETEREYTKKKVGDITEVGMSEDALWAASGTSDVLTTDGISGSLDAGFVVNKLFLLYGFSTGAVKFHTNIEGVGELTDPAYFWGVCRRVAKGGQ